MKKTIAILTMLCASMTLAAKNNDKVTLQLIETSDVHGAFFPYDFIERTPMAGTMARVSTYLKRLRKTYGNKVVVMDNGDILQGQPTCYYTNYVKTLEPNIAAQVINYLKYDAQTFGNHDVEVGHAVYDKWIRELQCPILGANIINNHTGKPYVQPYTLLEREGIRIAILGMLTPAIPNWLHESLWSGLRFEEMTNCARHWVKVLKEEEKADIVIGLFHSGWDGGIATSEYYEDASKRVAQQVEGFDVIFFGHDHTMHNSYENGVLCLDPANNAVNLAQATLQCTKVNGKWKVIKKTGHIVDITKEAIDEEFVRFFQPQADSIRHYVERKIGTFSNTIRSCDSFFGSAPFTDLIHQLQLENTGADISLTAPLTFNTTIEAGPIYMSDMFKLYRFENQIYTLRMTGQEVRKHLEMAYDLWTNTMKSPDDHIMLLKDSTLGDEQRRGFKNYTFNFDSAAGIDYVVDVTKPNGQKVHILHFSDGRPFSEDAWYHVAMNSYRGNGGGELLTLGAGISKDSIPSRIICQSPHDQRYYLTQMIQKAGTIEAKAYNNWHFIPEGWTKPAIERDRKLIFKQ